MDRFFKELAKLFSTCELKGSDADVARFRDLGVVQRTNYQRIQGILANIDIPDGSVDCSSLTDIFLTRVIEVLAHGTPQPEKHGDTVYLRSRFPIIQYVDISEFILEVSKKPHLEFKNAFQCWEFSSKMIAVIVSESDPLAFIGSNIDFKDNWINLFKYESQYIFFKNQTNIIGKLESKYEDELNLIESRQENLKTRLSDQLLEFNNTKNTYHDKFIEIEKNKIALEKELSEGSEKLSNFYTKTTEELKLNQTKILWRERHQSALVSFWLTAILLVLLLVIVPALAIYEYEFVFEFFKKIDSLSTVPNENIALSDIKSIADNPWALTISQLSRLILVSLPIALYIWLIRIVVRFFMRTMLLMDDARQRQVMLETYLFLVEQKRADEKDRPLILQALFRPAPGHGPDGVDPPNFTEVINAGYNRGRAE